jgi:hypothetical protein
MAQRFKERGPGARIKKVISPPFSGKPKLPRTSLKRISALSAFSSFTLLPSSPEGPAKNFLFPARRTEPPTAEMKEDAERMKQAK